MNRLEIPRSSSLYPDDVSPPESMRTISRDGKGSPDVSPITDPQSVPAEFRPAQGKYNSHIPVSKKTQVFGAAGSLFSRKIRPSALATSDRDSSGTGVTRWDDFSGERTGGEKGKPASASPDAVRREVELKYGKRKDSLGNSVEISGPTRQVSTKAPWVPVGWKGAGGRHAMPNPMLDKPLPPGKSPNFPAGHQRMASNESNKGNDSSRVAAGLDASLSPAPLRIRTPASQPREAAGQQKISEEVIPEPTIMRNYQQPTPPADSPRSNLSPDDTRSPLARNPSKEEFGEEPPSSPPNPTPVTNGESHKPETPDKAPISNFQNFNVANQPQSRFSATTYAPTVYDSPPTTPEMNQDLPTSSPASSILDRKRPVQQAGILSSKVAARKPTPSQLSTMEKTQTPIDRNDGLGKSLPKEPDEEKTVSRVESLTAKLDALRRRRGNLQTVIHELTNVVQPSSIAYDIASRQEIKKTVEGLNKELAEVTKQEHETGLKLHRAWKRHDDATTYEPTHLWVRRVTS